VKEYDRNAGLELLSLLRQQRYLYHQLRMLGDRQRRLAGSHSPQLLLEITSGRRKLVQKLRDLDCKLRPIKTNWPKLHRQISPEHRAQARETAGHIQEIVEQILAAAPSAAAQNLPLNENCRFDDLLVEPLTK
jgi:hypothetical protein